MPRKITLALHLGWFVFIEKKEISLSEHSMDSAGLDHVLKILMIGDAGVGKSSILQQFTDGYFSDQQQSTIGVDFKVKMMTVTGPDERPKRVKAPSGTR